MDSTELIGLGDDPALDFVNSIATPQQEPVEFLTDGQAYLDWLERAGLIEPADATAARRLFSPAQLVAVAEEAVALREWLRPAIAEWARRSGRPATGEPESVIPQRVRIRLNEILELDRAYPRLDVATGALVIERARHWHEPRQLLVPPAEAAARLLSAGDPALVRHCEGPTCTLWFYDRTKSHRRRWCSMAACGNRAKARAHRDRTRDH